MGHFYVNLANVLKNISLPRPYKTVWKIVEMCIVALNRSRIRAVEFARKKLITSLKLRKKYFWVKVPPLELEVFFNLQIVTAVINEPQDTKHSETAH